MSLSLEVQIKAAGLDPITTEYKFHATRRWRFDFAWPSIRLAIEIDGGGYTGGRHSRGKGMEGDCEKFAAAMAMGWRVLRVTPKQVQSGDALRWTQEAMQWETVSIKVKESKP